jgi:Ca2+-binding RTX toxin-like protein
MGGNDRLQAGFGDALASTSTWHLEGGAGDDTILALGGRGYAEGGSGTDNLDLRNGWQANARGGAGNDQIRGPLAPCAGCSNPLFGDAGDDSIVGGAARDDIDGGDGTDELHGAGADDVLVDSGSGAETCDCGDGWADIVQDLDGNGTGGNGTGYLNQPEDDNHVDCEAVIVAVPTCSYTPGETGCIVLTNVAITDNPSTATYLISGTVSFTPTCQLLAADCDPYPTIAVSGTGTFSVSGSQTASGTWTIPAAPNDRPNPSPYEFTDGTNHTTCAAAAIRQATFNLPLVASNGDTGGSWLQVRTDDIGTTSLVGGIFSTGPLPTGTFRNAAGSQAGVTILC